MRLVFWELTARCNLACKHCRAESQKDHNPFALTCQEGKDLVLSLTLIDGNNVKYLIKMPQNGKPSDAMGYVHAVNRRGVESQLAELASDEVGLLANQADVQHAVRLA